MPDGPIFRVIYNAEGSSRMDYEEASKRGYAVPSEKRNLKRKREKDHKPIRGTKRRKR